MTATLNADRLHQMLTQVAPHMCTDLAIPALCSIRLETSDHHLYAVATDRYTLAVSRAPHVHNGSDAALHLGAGYVPAVLAWLATVGTKPVEVALIPRHRRINFEADGATYEVPAVDIGEVRIPAWQRITRQLLAEEPQPVSITGFTTAYLARWAHADEKLSGWQCGDRKSLILTNSDATFLGMQMPTYQGDLTRQRLAEPWLALLSPTATVDGITYRLDRPLYDRDGDPWEYVRDNRGEPLMRLVGIADDDHTLPSVVRNFGPLSSEQPGGAR